MKMTQRILSMFSRRARSTTDSDGHAGSGRTFFGRPRAGVWVDEDSALMMSAVWRATSVISNSIACMPWHVFKELDGGGKERVHNNTDRLLHMRPNSENAAFGFRQTILGHVILWGNGYAEIERDLNGRPVNLWPITPDRVQVERQGGQLVYRVRNQGRDDTMLPPSSVFHLKGLGFDGLVGYSVVAMARESLGLTAATERFGAAWFGNGSRPGGVLEYPGMMKPQAKKDFREAWDSSHTGPDASNRVALLENGMKFTPLTVPPDDAQFLETRKFQVTEVARWFGVPPHKLADLDRATFSNIEEQNIDFANEGLMPWACRLEQEANAKLLGASQVSTRTFTKLNMDVILRGNKKSRNESHAIGRQWGYLSANDIRELEDMNPIDGGDTYLIPSNMTTTEGMDKMVENLDKPAPAPFAPPQEPIEEQSPEDGGDLDKRGLLSNIDRLKTAHMRLFVDAAERVVKREAAEARKMAKKHGSSGFPEAWGGYQIRQSAQVVKTFSAPMLTLADLSGDLPPGEASAKMDHLAGGFVQRHLNTSTDEAVEAVRSGTLDQLCDLWLIEKPAAMAVELTDLVAGAISGDSDHE